MIQLDFCRQQKTYILSAPYLNQFFSLPFFFFKNCEPSAQKGKSRKIVFNEDSQSKKKSVRLLWKPIYFARI